MFNFKFNSLIIKILLVLMIITFFTPFFSVSCESNQGDPGVNFSGFEISTGKTVGDYYQPGSFLGFILIIPSVLLLIISFCVRIKPKLDNICKYMLFIVPVFNFFAAFITWYAFRAEVFGILDALYYASIPLSVNIKYGFILYIFFNIAVFALAVINYFKIPPPQPAQPEVSSHQDA